MSLLSWLLAPWDRDKVLAAYRFLIFNYEPGDEIYVFGFSHGAVAAMSVVGMLRKCGIVARDKVGRIGDAFELYLDGTCDPDAEVAQASRVENSLPLIMAPVDVASRTRVVRRSSAGHCRSMEAMLET